ncbi:lipoprotein 17-related variable surface protein [Mycoplasmopsis agassizii]|uniref:lipoprotein 17-related variable surface protein n=1 Tax=Mycoplasmopsis agassizii TaxID=33922 RepID=UPI003527F743
MKRKFLITTGLSLGSVIAVTAAIACSPIDKPPAKETVEITLQKIATNLLNFELSIKEKETDTAVKSKIEAFTGEYKTNLLSLVKNTEQFSQFLGDAQITSIKVTTLNTKSIGLDLGLVYTEDGVSATNKTTIKIIGLGAKNSEAIQKLLEDEIAKFTDRNLKDNSSNKLLLASNSDINSLATYNTNTVGEAVEIDASVAVSLTKVSSDTEKGSIVLKVTLSKENETKTKDIKVSGFKIKTPDSDEKAVEQTYNNFNLKVANFDRGAEKLTVESFIVEQPGIKHPTGTNSSKPILKYDFDKNPDWLLSMSNSNSRASAYKPTVLDTKTFARADYFKKETADHLQAKLKEKDQIKLEEGVTGEVRVISSDDIKGEVVVAISFVKGSAKSEEKLLTIKNFLDQKELGTFAEAIYGSLVNEWNLLDKTNEPGFSNQVEANKYIEQMQEVLDQKRAYVNNVKVQLLIDANKGGIDYKDLKINLLGTYTVNNVILGDNDVVLQNFNANLSQDAKLVKEAYDSFTKLDYKVRDPKPNEKVEGKWVASSQAITPIDQLNDKLVENQKVTWTNQDKGVTVEVKTVDFVNKDGLVSLQLIFKKGSAKSEPVKITLSGFLTDKQVLDHAVAIFKKAMEKDAHGNNKYENRMKNYVLYLKLNSRQTLNDLGTMQMVAYQAYVTKLLNSGDGPARIDGLEQQANGAILVFVDGGLAGDWEFTVHYGGLVSEIFTLKIPYAKTQNI